jgi:hypothetical protein
MVFYTLNQLLENRYKRNHKQMCAELDSNFGCMSDDAEQSF